MRAFDFVSCFSGFLFASVLGAQILEPPPPSHSLETRWENIDGLNFLKPNLLLLLPHHQNFLIKTPFDPSKKKRDEIFGNFVKSEKTPLPVVTSFHGSWHADKISYLWDGVTMEFAEFDESFTLVRRQSIILDKIRPPKDMIGELTNKKISDLRQRFLGAYKTSQPPFFPGIAPLPQGWVSSQKHQFVLASRIPKFPIVTLECEESNPITCALARACKLKGDIPVPTHITGIAVSPRQKKILIGDALSHRIRVYNFRSCEAITKSSELLLPKKLKQMTNLFIDTEDRLWVSTSHRDDYNNSSVFYWDSQDWAN